MWRCKRHRRGRAHPVCCRLRAQADSLDGTRSGIYLGSPKHLPRFQSPLSCLLACSNLDKCTFSSVSSSSMGADYLHKRAFGTPESLGLYSSPTLGLFIFITLHFQAFSLGILAIASSWILRYLDGLDFWQDLSLCIFWAAWISRRHLAPTFESLRRTLSPDAKSYSIAWATLGLFAFSYVVYRAAHRRHHEVPKDCTKQGRPTRWPRIHPSRTTHTRMFPQKHSFSYSYLLVSVPVEFEGACGSLFSTGRVKSRTLFSVHASDHLERTSCASTLKQKLTEYLHSQVNSG